jgi:hypothetical protein
VAAAPVVVVKQPDLAAAARTPAAACLRRLQQRMTDAEVVAFQEKLRLATDDQTGAAAAAVHANAAWVKAGEADTCTSAEFWKAFAKSSELTWKFLADGEVTEPLTAAKAKVAALQKLHEAATADVQAAQADLRAAEIRVKACDVRILRLTTWRRVREVLSGIPAVTCPGLLAFYASVRDIGWLRAIRAKGTEEYRRDVGGMLLALYSRTCKSKTLRVMVQYMDDDPLIFMAAMMFAGTLLKEALAEKRWPVQVALRNLAAAALSLTKTGPSALKTPLNFLFAYAQVNELYESIKINRSFVTDDFVSEACGLKAYPQLLYFALAKVPKTPFSRAFAGAR